MPDTPNPDDITRPRVTAETVRAVARLSRLALDGDDTHAAEQLELILTYVAKIGRVDVTGTEPMAHASGLHTVLRDDVVEPSLELNQVLANAPETDGPFFKVPKIIGAEEDSAG